MAAFFSETIELLLIISVIPLSALGFFPTWKNHKNYRLLSGYIISIASLLIGYFLFHGGHAGGFDPVLTFFQILFMVFGALFLAYIIYKNKRHTHVCSNPHHDHSH